MADNPTQKFGDVVDRFTEQVKPVTKGIESVTRTTQRTNKIIEGLSDNLKSQLEGLGSTVEDITKSIFDTDKPFKIDFEAVNKQLGKAQATIDVLNDRLTTNTENFSQLTVREEKAIRAQIKATEKFVKDTQGIATGSKAVLQSLTAQTVGKIEESTMGALSSLPVIGPFLSTFLSDQIKILKARKLEYKKQKQTQLAAQAKEKALNDERIENLQQLLNVDRETAEETLRRQKTKKRLDEELDAQKQELIDLVDRGIITEKDSQKRLKQLEVDKKKEFADTYGTEQPKGIRGRPAKTKPIEISKNSIKELAVNSGKNVVKALDKQKPDASVLKEQRMKKQTTQAGAKGTVKGGQDGGFSALGLGLLGPALTGIVGALTAAAPLAPVILAGGGAIGGGLGLILAGLGIGAGVGLAAASGGVALLGKSIDSFTTPLKNLKDAIQEYEDLDGDKLGEVGEGLSALAGPMAKTGIAGILAKFVGENGIENLKGLATVVEKYQGLDPEKMGQAADALGKFGPALNAFAGEGAMASFKSFVGGLLDFVTLGDDPIEKLQKFGDIADPLNNANDAMKGFTPTFKKFYNMIQGKDFENIGESFKDFGIEFKKGLNNIANGMNSFRNIDVEKLDGVSGLIQSVANLTRAQQVGNLSVENAQLGSMIGTSGSPSIASNIVTQNNNQGIVISQSVDNDNLDSKIVAYNYP